MIKLIKQIRFFIENFSTLIREIKELNFNFKSLTDQIIDQRVIQEQQMELGGENAKKLKLVIRNLDESTMATKNFITALVSHLAFDKKIKIDQEKRESERDEMTTPTPFDDRY